MLKRTIAIVVMLLMSTVAFAEPVVVEDVQPVYTEGESYQPVYTEGESYQIEVLADGQMQVRKATRVYRDGVEISKTYHRHVLSPGADVTEEVERVKDISKAVWTEDTVKKYKDKQKKNEPVEVIVEPVEELIIGE